MFTNIRNFVNRHRRKFIIGSILIGGYVLLSRYTQRKIREWQEKEVRDLLEQTKRQQYFENIERTCNQTILKLAITLRKSVIKELDTEEIVEQLRNRSTEKISAWNNLKVLAFTRTIVIIYSYTMLVVTLRIQLNLIGGLAFKESLHNNKPELKAAFETVWHSYLSLSGYFMNEGIKNLCNFVKEIVEQVTSSISLKDKLTIRHVEQLYWTIISTIITDVERDPAKNLSSYMVPKTIIQNYEKDKISSGKCQLSDVDKVLQNIIRDTIKRLDSEEVRLLIESTIASGFHIIIDHITEYFTQNSTTTETDKENSISLPGPSNVNDITNIGSTLKTENTYEVHEFMNFTKVKMPMAKIIPILKWQVSANSTKGDVPSEWLERLILNEKFKILGADVYKDFSN